MRMFRFFLVIVLTAMVPGLSFAEEAFPFKGRIDFSKKEFDVVLDLGDESSVAARAQKSSENDYWLMLDIGHLKTPFFDLLSKIESSVEVVREEDGSSAVSGNTTYRGRIWSQYSLVDYKPVRELSGSFEVKDRRLQLTALSFGNLQCNGYIDLSSPYKLDLVFNLYDVDMPDFLNFWGVGREYESAGAVSGEIRAFGTPDRLALKGNLESRQGYVQKLDYDIISLNIEGVYPHMEVAHSTISKSDGMSFTLDGPLDLHDKANFKKQIKALTVAPLVNDSGPEREWTIKRLNNPVDSETTELKYRFRKGDALGTGTSAEDEIDILILFRTVVRSHPRDERVASDF